MQDDREVIAEVLQGNKEAYALIVNKYKGKIASILGRTLHHSHDAEDMVQEVFIKAYYSLPDYKPNYSFSAWLYRIAINRGIDELRKRKRMPFVTEMDVEVRDECPIPEEDYLEKEQRHALRQQMMTLDKNHRTILDLHYLQHLSYREIGNKLSLSVDTVRMRLSYARKKLRDQLSKPEKKGGTPL
ncbi:RNA polymerase sigma factor [Brevibacillus sp. Leaf182]|uniref:RNA polymerase sigma factor n=1 Tax=Brevibacillus sp. Leaf182 TaxID=1736290 RepID=UPI00070234CE|nr:sigma-70 family RNA polymerase sigma factor [Brevibacillus sp. Leaf182]RAT97813.1 RNA polymerase [Brevibacillus sp. Leaf182]